MFCNKKITQKNNVVLADETVQTPQTNMKSKSEQKKHDAIIKPQTYLTPKKVQRITRNIRSVQQKKDE